MSLYNSFILADNQDLTRVGVRAVITSMVDDAHIVTVSCKHDLIRELKHCGESIVVIDYSLFDIFSIDELRILKVRFSGARWLLLSAELSENFIRQIVSEPDVSIALKDNSLDEIREGLKCVREGSRFVCRPIEGLLRSAAEKRDTKNDLTPTEIEILKMVAHGLSVKEIAAKRVSSTHTINTHKKNIFRKLDVNNVYEATRYALRAGLVELVEYYI